MRIVITCIGDQKFLLNKSSVNCNDVRGIVEMFKECDIDADCIDVNSYDKANNYDVLIIKMGVIVNWGGIQSEYLRKGIEMINNFKGEVFILSVDQDFIFPNEEREGFIRVERPVHFLYSGKEHAELASKELKGFDEIINTGEFNQGVGIGKIISRYPFTNIEPCYDAVYGGQARKELMKLITKIAKNYSLVSYGGLRNKIEQYVVPYYEKVAIDSLELRSINSLGNYTFLFFKPKTRWYTPRIFEQMASNSLAMFDTRWTETKSLWTEHNTFSSFDELFERLKDKPKKEYIEEQHEKFLDFDFDSYNQRMVQNILDLI